MGQLSLRLFLPVFLLAVSAVGFAADAPHERTQVGRAITVNAGEQVSDVTCFGCGVHIRGRVSGDVTTFGGTVVIENDGEVGGDTTIFGGDLRLESNSKVKDITVFGGHIRRDALATVAGDVTTIGGGATIWLFVVFGLPFLLLGAFVALIVWLVRRFTRPAVAVAAQV